MALFTLELLQDRTGHIFGPEHVHCEINAF